MHKLLQCYPFSDPMVQLVEGFQAYDGVLHDPPGTPHKGIDYVLKSEGGYRPFDVYTMHDGLAYHGVSQTWGNYVVVYVACERDLLYRTVYAHLEGIPRSMAPHVLDERGKSIRNPHGTSVRMGTFLGRAGASGLTHDIIQLHIELQDMTHTGDDESRSPVKLDPYGINDRASSGKYPQPGSSLRGLSHAWTTDDPPFAQR